MIVYLIIYTFFAIILALVTLIYFKLVRSPKRLYDIFKNQGVPCEPFIPVVGQLFDMFRADKQDKGLEYYYELAQKHGNHFLFGMGPYSHLILAEPELLADVLSRSKAENYEKTTLFINILKPLIGLNNLLVSKHEEHERTRKMLNPAFHSVNLKSMVPIMSNETTKYIDTLLSTLSPTEPIKLDTEFSTLTFSIIGSSAFGQSFETLPLVKKIICEAFTEAKDLIEYRTRHMINQNKFLDELPFWGRSTIDEARKTLDIFVNQAIIDRRNGKSSSLCSGQDLLDLLLSAVDDQGESFSDAQIKEEALTFVLAGHETTSNLMTWVIYALSLHDDVLQACLEEIDRVLPNGTIPNFEHLADLQVVEAVLHETLRLYPAAPFFARQCVKEHTIASSDGKTKIHIPVNTMIVVNTYVLHRREDYWSRPLEFDYKRWIRDPVTGFKPKLSHPFAYIPFAAGPRNCIGQNFALLEAKVILALFLQRCSFKLVPGQKVVPDMKGVTMQPKYGLFAYIKKRDI